MRSSRTASSQWLKLAFNVERHIASSEIPAFLCPAIIRPTTTSSSRLSPRIPGLHSRTARSQTSRLHTAAAGPNAVDTVPEPTLLRRATKSLPVACSGCGALSQVTEPEQAGYFDLKRKAVQSYLGLLKEEKRVRKEDLVVQDVLKNLDLGSLGDVGETLRSLAGANTAPVGPESSSIPDDAKPPLCDRCHKLVHHHTGVPIYHPTIDSIRETIEESPYKYNHVYHVIDAADFPMSLIPRINDLLDLMPLRSTNRRSKTAEFIRGQKTEVSFIITRSDLLAPRKEQVDSLMPYLTETLRSALGRRGRNVRLGNVWCVSAKRNWWTKELKEEVWKNRGASWMVGKVNVGKSQLFEAIFPKGRMDWKPKKHEIGIQVFASDKDSKFKKPNAADPLAVDEGSLLPPPQEETQFPPMPVVSSLPGTTASPIRVPFGNGRGELIDLPGLNRSDLEAHVLEEHRHHLVMKSRIVPEQQVIKPGQSLLIGGLIRITPATPGLIFLAYSFTPLEAHVTSTEKAIAVQEQADDAPNVENISVPGTGELIKKAGSFELCHDVTKIRAGPITRKEAVGISVDRLPYRVVGIDILVEGCGWVEIVAQMRTRDLFRQKPAEEHEKREEVEEGTENKPARLQTLDLRPEAEKQPETETPTLTRGTKGTPDRLQSLDLLSDDAPNERAEEESAQPTGPAWPVVEVFSPNGKFIASRRPLNGWMLNKPKKTATKSRPRPSMKGVKIMEKRARREMASSYE